MNVRDLVWRVLDDLHRLEPAVAKEPVLILSGMGFYRMFLFEFGELPSKERDPRFSSVPFSLQILHTKYMDDHRLFEGRFPGTSWLNRSVYPVLRFCDGQEFDYLPERVPLPSLEDASKFEDWVWEERTLHGLRNL